MGDFWDLEGWDISQIQICRRDLMSVAWQASVHVSDCVLTLLNKSVQMHIQYVPVTAGEAD